jgi:hypothetical protein
MKLTNKYSMLIIFSFCLLASCKNIVAENNSEGIVDSTANVSQSAMSAAASSAASSESGAVGVDFVDPSDGMSNLVNSCTLSTARGACSNSQDIINWAGCKIDGTNATLTGGWTETFTNTSNGSSAGDCTTPVGDGKTITRTSSGSIITFSNGSNVKTDTNGGTAWDGTTITAGGESISRSGLTRTITLHGIHKVLKGPKGTTWFDHYITSNGITVTGARATSNREVNGSIKIYHNRLKYTANNTFNTVTYGDSNCCYPTSGNISSTLTGSISGTMNMEFTSTCGVANFTDSTGATSSITLNQCN